MTKRVEIKVTAAIPEGDAFAESDILSAAKEPAKTLQQAISSVLESAGASGNDVTIEVKIVSPPVNRAARGSKKKSDSTAPRTGRVQAAA